jgi:hypothetical protein
MASTYDSAHLLTIPREIRYSIYDLVIHCEPTEAVWNYEEAFERSKYKDIVSKTPEKRFSLPWINLLSTCKLVKNEMTAYMKPSSGTDPVDRFPWVLDIIASDDGRLEAGRWREISCHPASIKTLIANISTPRKVLNFWGDGGPMPIVWELYQTLNWILHFGPVLRRQNPLSSPLRLRTLVIRVISGPPREHEKPMNSRLLQIRGSFNVIRRLIERLNNTGLLANYINNVKMIDESTKDELDIAIEHDEDPQVPEAWKDYGFGWGPDGNR